MLRSVSSPLKPRLAGAVSPGDSTSAVTTTSWSTPLATVGGYGAKAVLLVANSRRRGRQVVSARGDRPGPASLIPIAGRIFQLLRDLDQLRQRGDNAPETAGLVVTPRRFDV